MAALEDIRAGANDAILTAPGVSSVIAHLHVPEIQGLQREPSAPVTAASDDEVFSFWLDHGQT